MKTLALLITLAIGLAQPALAATYKWKDDKGKIHYGSVPPGGGVAYQEIDKSGRVIRSVESFEAQRQRQQGEQKNAQSAAAVREQQRKDRALLASYTSAAEIDQMRNRAVAQEKLQMDSLMQQLDQARKNLASIEQKIGGKKPSPVQQQQREEASAMTQALQERQAKLEAAMSGTQARFAADKQRYLELTGGR